MGKMLGTGLEHLVPNLGKAAIADLGGVVGARNIPIEIDLQLILDAWPKLNPTTRAGIVAMVRAARD